VRIEFKSEGGLAHFPGLSKPIVIDTAQLPQGESVQLEGLVDAARFFDLPAVVGLPRPGAADYRKHTITITDGTRSHCVQVYDPIQPQELGKLVAALKTKTPGKP
jgi:hypothetical protein